MKTLYLHIGETKTGSTAIQNFLRDNRALLLAAGIDYPSRNEGTGFIQSGNGDGLLHRPARLDAALKAGRSDALLFSSEFFCRDIAQLADIAAIQAVLAKHGVSSIRILLFIRNPVEHAMSLWQQLVKRSGLTSGIDAFLDTYTTPQVVRQAVETATDRLGADVSIWNYSNQQGRIFDILESWLEVTLPRERQPAAPVNRGLTLAELEFQRQLNRHRGSPARILADALCTTLPHIVPDRIVPSLQAQQRMLARLQPDLDFINGMVDAQNRYAMDLTAPREQETRFCLDTRQIELMVDILAHLPPPPNRLQRSWHRTTRLLATGLQHITRRRPRT